MSDDPPEVPERPYPTMPRIPDPTLNVWQGWRGQPTTALRRVNHALYGKAGPDAEVDERPLPGFGFECGCCDPAYDIGEATTLQKIGDSFEAFTDWRMVLGLTAATLLGAGLGAGFGAMGGAGAQAAHTDGAGGAGVGGFMGAVVGMLLGTLGGAAGGSDVATAAGLGVGALGLVTGAIGGVTGNPLAGAAAGAIAGGVLGLAGGMAGYSLLKQKATRELARVVPSWTYALNPKRTDANRAMSAFRFTPTASETELEIMGVMTQSFQTWTDVPVYQYHQYFDWNFYVKPAEGYRQVGSWASVHRPDASHALDAEPEVPEMECEWDTAAFSGPLGNASTPQPDPPGASPNDDAAMFRDLDLAWPMAGQPIWMAGRWVFDCGHGNPIDGADPASVRSQRMRLELHPLKAVASARYEGVRFAENQNFYVPGVRVMFFASRFGGYYRFNAINQKDYEFLIDLPRHPDAGVMTWRAEDHPSLPGSQVLVGTSTTSHRTNEPGTATPLTTRTTRLLIRFDTVPYETTMRGKKAALQPRVRALPVTGLVWANDQVKLIIPLAQAAADDDAYGVIVEMGWLDDRDLNLARSVKRYTVTFHSVEKLDAYSHDIAGDIPLTSEGGCEEWRLRFGVNGRWAQTPETEIDGHATLPLHDKQFTVHLCAAEHAPDALTVCCHGTEHDQVEDIFREPQSRRSATVDGRVLTHEDVFQCTDNDRRRQITRAMYALQWRSLANTSDPLARVLEDTTAHLVRPEEKHISAIALVEDHRLAETNLDPQRRNDYRLHYGIEVAEQSVPGRPA